jgi:hypothetical protein
MTGLAGMPGTAVEPMWCISAPRQQPQKPLALGCEARRPGEVAVDDLDRRVLATGAREITSGRRANGGPAGASSFHRRSVADETGSLCLAEPPAGQRATELEEGGVKLGPAFTAGTQPAEVVQPGEGPLDDPADHAQARAVLRAAARDHRLVSAPPQLAAVLVVVMPRSATSRSGRFRHRPRRPVVSLLLP